MKFEAVTIKQTIWPKGIIGAFFHCSPCKEIPVKSPVICCYQHQLNDQSNPRKPNRYAWTMPAKIQLPISPPHPQSRPSSPQEKNKKQAPAPIGVIVKPKMANTPYFYPKTKSKITGKNSSPIALPARAFLTPFSSQTREKPNKREYPLWTFPTPVRSAPGKPRFFFLIPFPPPRNQFDSSGPSGILQEL